MRVKSNQNQHNKARLEIWSKFLLNVVDSKTSTIEEAEEKFNSDEIIKIPMKLYQAVKQFSK